MIAQGISLVDIDGMTVPCTERFTGPEPDPTDPAEWPAWTDNWYFEPTDSAELLALEAERVADLHDAPNSAWLRMAQSLPALCGGAPEPFVPSDEDWADYRQWCEETERRDALQREQNARHPLYGNE